MKAQRQILAAIGLAILCSATGCATIVSGQHADVAFHSNVANADVVIRNKRGEQVAVTRTGSEVALKRKDGLIFPARYTATFAAPGYQPAVVPINSTVNPWIAGNIVVGGVIGLAVDSATGAAWSPKRSTYYQELTPLAPAWPAYPAVGYSPAPVSPGPQPGGPAATGAIHTASATNQY